jgi:ubiquitin carboxyl-terminal hydrolase 36/42
MRDNGALVGSKASTSKAWGKVVGAVQQTKALKQIEYVKALKPSNAFPSSSSSGSSHQTKTTQPAPREPSSRSLFDDNLVFKYMNWLKLIPPGPGLYNLGNTCFLNSTLQCLLHTPALVQILQHEASKALVGIASADQNQNQNLVSISQHFQRLVFEASSTRGGGAISPRAMVYNVRRVGKQFKQGRQEDAHEYLRQLLDTMHEEVLKANRIKLSDGKVSETTFIGRVFGGDLCNELRCKQVS